MAIKRLGDYYGKMVRHWWDVALKQYSQHDVVEYVGQGDLQRWRCRAPQTMACSFDVIQSDTTLVICGDIGDLIIGRYRGTLNWLYGSYTDLNYVAEKCEAGKIREYSQQVAEENWRKWLEEADIEQDEDDDNCGFENEHEYYDVMFDAGDDEPASPLEYTCQFIHCVAAGVWLADKVLAKGGA